MTTNERLWIGVSLLLKQGVLTPRYESIHRQRASRTQALMLTGWEEELYTGGNSTPLTLNSLLGVIIPERHSAVLFGPGVVVWCGSIQQMGRCCLRRVSLKAAGQDRSQPLSRLL